jgi:hypothetical protein
MGQARSLVVARAGDAGRVLAQVRSTFPAPVTATGRLCLPDPGPLLLRLGAGQGRPWRLSRPLGLLHQLTLEPVDQVHRDRGSFVASLMGRAGRPLARVCLIVAGRSNLSSRLILGVFDMVSS